MLQVAKPRHHHSQRHVAEVQPLTTLRPISRKIVKSRTMPLVDLVPTKLKTMCCHADRPRQSAKSNMLDPTIHSISLLICPPTLPRTGERTFDAGGVILPHSPDRCHLHGSYAFLNLTSAEVHLPLGCSPSFPSCFRLFFLVVIFLLSFREVPDTHSTLFF